MKELFVLKVEIKEMKFINSMELGKMLFNVVCERSHCLLLFTYLSMNNMEIHKT